MFAAAAEWLLLLCPGLAWPLQATKDSLQSARREKQALQEHLVRVTGNAALPASATAATGAAAVAAAGAQPRIQSSQQQQQQGAAAAAAGDGTAGATAHAALQQALQQLSLRSQEVQELKKQLQAAGSGSSGPVTPGVDAAALADAGVPGAAPDSGTVTPAVDAAGEASAATAGAAAGAAVSSLGGSSLSADGMPLPRDLQEAQQQIRELRRQLAQVRQQLAEAAALHSDDDEEEEEEEEETDEEEDAQGRLEAGGCGCLAAGATLLMGKPLQLPLGSTLWHLSLWHSPAVPCLLALACSRRSSGSSGRSVPGPAGGGGAAAQPGARPPRQHLVWRVSGQWHGWLGEWGARTCVSACG